MKKLKKLILLLAISIMTLNSNIDKSQAMSFESNTGEIYEISDSLYDGPFEENNNGTLRFKDIKPLMINIGSENEIIIDYDNLIKVNNTLKYPYSTSAYVDINNGYARGSANFIADNVLITAAHNVYDWENKYYYDNISIIPAASPTKQPYGKINVTKIFMLSDYKSRDYVTSEKNDLALLIIDKPIGAKVGTLGLYNKSKNYINRSVTITGYPSYNFKLKQMYTDSKKITNDDNNFLKYEVDTLGGSSGSAVYDSNLRVIGVHVAGNRKEKKNISIKINDRNLNFVHSVINRNKLFGWKKLNNDWYYYTNKGKLISDWYFDKNNNKKYYFNKNGIMETGWLSQNNNWYFFDRQSGFMEIGWVFDRDFWYFLDRKTGIMEKGWLLDKNDWYFLDRSSGKMEKGWLNDKDDWYFLDRSSGKMEKGWLNDKDDWYFLDRSSGKMEKGWLNDNNKWYFLDRSSGKMKKGWLNDNNKWYYLDEKNGDMLTGKHYIGGKLYFFDESGKLL